MCEGGGVSYSKCTPQKYAIIKDNNYIIRTDNI